MICRSCGGETRLVLDLGEQPLANNLVGKDEVSKCYPLNVVFCDTCHLGQLGDTVPPTEMFSKYLYYSSASPSVVNEAKVLVDKISPKLNSNSLVIEIASNDGYLLQFYKEKGIPVLGIDPSDTADVALSKGILTHKGFFNLSLAKSLENSGTLADVIHANNVLAHVPNINDFVAGLYHILKPDGECIIEVPYFGDLLVGVFFDTVYHEHVYYFSFESLDRLFSRHSLVITNVEHIEPQGGSLRLTIKKQGQKCEFKDYGLLNVCALQDYADYVATKLYGRLSWSKDTWGYGAAAKATVMMNYAGIDNSLVTAVVDDAPAKIGKFIPGTNIEIKSSKDWLAAQPSRTCIFSWNYASELIKRYEGQYRGKYFTPYSV